MSKTNVLALLELSILILLLSLCLMPSIYTYFLFICNVALFFVKEYCYMPFVGKEGS